MADKHADDNHSGADGSTLGPLTPPAGTDSEPFSHPFADAAGTYLEPVHVQGMSIDESFELWTENELSERLGVPVKTLQRWRAYGGGPRFVKVGRAARYRPAAVLAWFEEREVERASDLKKVS